MPVGEDQAPHIEIAREIVRRFNNLYGEVFPEPQTLLTEAKRIPGTDGRKMSKSYGNAIYLKDDPETVAQKLKPMLTDPARKRRTDPGNPDVCPVFDLHKAFSPAETRDWAAAGCRTAGIGCLDCKAKLTEHLLERLTAVHARRPEFATRPDTVWDILVEGSKKAREVAEATMEDVRGAMKIRYRAVSDENDKPPDAAAIPVRRRCPRRAGSRRPPSSASARRPRSASPSRRASSRRCPRTCRRSICRSSRARSTSCSISSSARRSTSTTSRSRPSRGSTWTTSR